jgi:hypothetical protein
LVTERLDLASDGETTGRVPSGWTHSLAIGWASYRSASFGGFQRDSERILSKYSIPDKLERYVKLGLGGAHTESNQRLMYTSA